ncbi:hypothetical protein EI42_02948 [Thermosporothrix hazakensis]|jgi:hypothetical protein|uniref:Zinc ribbon protein n=1 Tax=Thermosporothrix hazakensis TaxID=644383 RepID=A0A326U5J6_THEHA|nr:hypothetical protein [Thermosporothrix hazakensis]PZW29226.1 hypothetical protein EI42_02948 [Thermosporothrix hazakensis]GCE45421.1 hypothetical protein KTH_02900 [Thermosporothrix hazakensis]
MGNIWESVQRGFEKASQEAGRIAKTQRLRSTIDKVTRQLERQQEVLTQTTMDLFLSGRLVQSELLPVCQEFHALLQQLEQAQLELKLLQQGATTPLPPPPPPEYVSPEPVTPVPPPPPGFSPADLPTIAQSFQPPERRFCLACGHAMTSSDAFCSNCGQPVSQPPVTSEGQ